MYISGGYFLLSGSTAIYTASNVLMTIFETGGIIVAKVNLAMIITVVISLKNLTKTNVNSGVSIIFLWKLY